MLLRPHAGAHTDDPSGAAGADVSQGYLCFHSCAYLYCFMLISVGRTPELNECKSPERGRKLLGSFHFSKNRTSLRNCSDWVWVAHFNSVKLEFTTMKRPPIIIFNLLPCLYPKADPCVACVHILFILLCSWCCCHLSTVVDYFD